MDPYRLPGARPGLLQRVATAIAGVVVLSAVFFLGIIAWVILAGIVFVGSIALSIWIWRQKRLYRKHSRTIGDSAPNAATARRNASEAIEGEYEVVSDNRRSDWQRRQ